MQKYLQRHVFVYLNEICNLFVLQLKTKFRQHQVYAAWAMNAFGKQNYKMQNACTQITQKRKQRKNRYKNRDKSILMAFLPS